MTMGDVMHILIALIIFGALGLKLVLKALGKEKIVVKDKERTPWAVVSKDDNQLTVETSFDMVNEGKQCGTVMDAIARCQLPYEQYDKIEARGKAQMLHAPREDDYFEAVLIQKGGDKIRVQMLVTLRLRKGESLDEALRDMVDMPIEFIYLETGRVPCHYSKVRFVLTAEEIKGLCNTEEKGAK